MTSGLGETPRNRVRLLLVDGHYYLYRSYFAIRGLTNSRGEPTNAIFGFTKALRKMVQDLRPDFGAVVWDRGVPARRSSLQPAYKAQRPPMPDEMRPQEEFMMALAPLLGLQSLSAPDTEADDLIASYACAAADCEVLIATNDKDILQLVDDRVRIYSTNKADLLAPTDSHALLGVPEVRAKWGVEPAQIGDVLALTGDSSDNIPGVPGVGQKTAAALVREFGSAEALLANVEKISKPGVRASVTAAADIIVQNREMVRLDLDLPLPVPVVDLMIRPQYPELIDAIRRCEFRTLLAEIEAESRRPAAGSPTLAQGDLF